MTKNTLKLRFKTTVRDCQEITVSIMPLLGRIL
jgi:hypothetical protein